MNHDEDDDNPEQPISPARALANARNTLHHLQMVFETNVEIGKTHSKLLHARYESLIEAGFSQEQAFELIRHRGLQ